MFLSISTFFMTASVLSGFNEPGVAKDAPAIMDIFLKNFLIVGLMSGITYFIRFVMTQTFKLQLVAENSRDAMNSIFDNLPDSVLLNE